jgi:hypothetical protein
LVRADQVETRLSDEQLRPIAAGVAGADSVSPES